MKRLLLVALVLTAGCSGGSSTAQPSGTSTPTPTASPTPATAASLVLEVDGLGVSDGAAHISHFPFATTTAAQIQGIVSPLLGSGVTTTLPECGQGPRTSYKARGLTLLFDKAAWVGWTSQTAGLTTADGVGVGVTRKVVDASGTAFTFSESSLGTEFTAENSGLGGLMSGPDKTDTVTALYTGETCFAR